MYLFVWLGLVRFVFLRPRFCGKQYSEGEFFGNLFCAAFLTCNIQLRINLYLFASACNCLLKFRICITIFSDTHWII